MGELGQTLFNLLVSKDINSAGLDIDKSKCKNNPSGNFKVMHVCLPYSENFIHDSLDYIRLFSPEYVIIHSTIQPNTTKLIQEQTKTKIIYSPSRGIHRRFLEDMVRYTKFYSYYGQIDLTVMDIFDKRFDFYKFIKEPKTLEAAKILVDTTYYGLLISYRKIVDEYCIAHNISVDDVWEFAKEIHEFLGNRPIMYNDNKPIGGHCVMQNLELIKGNESLESIKSIIHSSSTINMETY